MPIFAKNFVSLRKQSEKNEPCHEKIAADLCSRHPGLHDCNFRVIVKYVDKWNKNKLKESVLTPEEFRKAAKNAGFL